jgi:hypothetical protein
VFEIHELLLGDGCVSKRNESPLYGFRYLDLGRRGEEWRTISAQTLPAEVLTIDRAVPAVALGGFVSLG